MAPYYWGVGTGTAVMVGWGSLYITKQVGIVLLDLTYIASLFYEPTRQITQNVPPSSLPVPDTGSDLWYGLAKIAAASAGAGLVAWGVAKALMK